MFANKNMTLSLVARTAILAVAAFSLAGCALGNIELSGALPPTDGTAHINITGKAIGGRQPISYAKLQLWAVGGSGYGSAATELTTNLSTTTNQYYPGGATGCSTAPDTISFATIVSGTATFQAPNTLRVGQLVSVSDATNAVTGTVPVTAATATTFAVATTAADSAGTDSGSATPVCYATPTTDISGSFTITGDYACGGNTGSIVYLTSKGGNPGLTPASAVNSRIALAALLENNTGTTAAPVALTCGGLTSSVNVVINELSTAAMGVAMGQYFNPTLNSSDDFGSPTTTQASIGIKNAAATALTLVNTTNGSANASFTLSSTPYSVKVTPEATKVGTIANILAACVNSAGGAAGDGSNCGNLFTGTEPAGATQAATDTLQAAALFALNPNPNNTNSNLLWGLVSSSPAFAGLSTQPADYSVGITYADNNSACTVGTNCVLNQPQEIAFDGTGNIWVMNHNSTTSGSLSELNAFGSPLMNTNTIGGTSFNAISPRNLVVDTNGNVDIGTSTTSEVFQYNSATPASSVALPFGNQPYGLVLDSSNNLFIGQASTSLTFTYAEFPTDTIATSNAIEFPAWCSTTTNAYVKCSSRSPAETNTVLPQYGALDTAGNLWWANGGNAPTTAIETLTGYSATCTVYPCLATTSGDTVNYTYTLLNGATGSFPTFSTPYGLAAGPAGRMWIANHGASANTVSEMTSLTAGTNFGTATSFNQPYWVAMDGAGNPFVVNVNGAVSELQGTGTSTGTVLSPQNTGTAPFTNVGYVHTITTGFGGAVDLSGNVWAASYSLAGALQEIVGIGVPTITPLASQVNAFKTTGTAKP